MAPTRRVRRGHGTLTVAVLLILLAAACQPVDRLDARAPTAGQRRSSDLQRLGAPLAGMPDGLEGLLQRGDDAALQWQAEPRLAEVWVGLDDRMAWTEARLTYLAADADRFLTLELTPTGGVQERPTLITLGLKPVPARGLEQLPPVPADAHEPAALAQAARAALIECGVDEPVRGVLYATGAPASWDGQRWAEPPMWTAMVTGPGGEGAVVDPVSGARASDVCLQPTGS